MSEITGSMLASGVINGLCLAGIYILIALGLTLILSIMNILQFAHGEIYMIGAYIIYFLMVNVGLNVYLAFLVSMIATGLLGVLLERFFFRRFLGKFLPVICIAIGLMLILQTGAVLIFGLNVRAVPCAWPGALDIMAIRIPYDRLVAVLFCIVLTVALFLFLKRSKLGLAIIATAKNHEGALLQGINPNLMYALVMAIGSALAAVGGGFAGSIFILDPFMGGAALMKGVTIIVLGGMGSLVGVIVGGIILGLCDGLIVLAFGPAAATIAPLVLVIIVLIFRPEGIFGHS